MSSGEARSATGGSVSGPSSASSSPLHISVTDPVKHGEGVNAYMSYSVVTKGGEGRLEKNSIRRFSDFEWLHSRLCAVHRGVLVPPLPDKNVVEKFRFSRDFIEARRRALEKFLARVCEHPVLSQSRDLQHFLLDDEDTWARQTLAPADSRGGVLGKKSNEYMNLFKEVQWGLSSIVLGRPSPSPSSLPPGRVGAEGGALSVSALVDSEVEHDRLKQYAEELERVLTDAHRQAFVLIRKQKETAGSLSSLGAALVALGQVEGATLLPLPAGSRLGQQHSLEGSGTQLAGGDTEQQQQRHEAGLEGGQQEQHEEEQERASLMGQAFVDVGRRCETAAALISQQSSSYTEQVEESLKEYVRMVHSLKRVLGEHSSAVREERHLEAELHVKKARLEKLQATPVAGAVDRVRELEADVADAQGKLSGSSAQREKLVQSMHEDLQRFHSVMLRDLSQVLRDIYTLHTQLAQRLHQCWEEALPLLQRASAKQQAAMQTQQQQQLPESQNGDDPALSSQGQ